MSRRPQPLTVVSYGGGVNSTALVIGLLERHQPLDCVLFADTGGEKPETYAFLERFDRWLEEHTDGRLPGVDRCRASTPGALAHGTLEQECLNNRTLPSLAFGFKGCSVKWKRQAMDKWLLNWQPALEVWDEGGQIERLLGIHAGESHRSANLQDDDRCRYRRPLVEWGWDHDDCVAAIERAGLPVPPKSACFFCPAMKKAEVLQLAATHPDLMQRALAMEDSFRSGPHWRPDGTTKGLGQRRWSWRELLAAEGKLPGEAAEQPCGCYDGGEE